MDSKRPRQTGAARQSSREMVSTDGEEKEQEVELLEKAPPAMRRSPLPLYMPLYSILCIYIYSSIYYLIVYLQYILSIRGMIAYDAIYDVKPVYETTLGLARS